MMDKYKKKALSEEEMEQIEETLLNKMFTRKADAEMRENLGRLAIAIGVAEAEHSQTALPAEKPMLKVEHQRKWLVWAAAASVLILLGVAWWFMGRR